MNIGMITLWNESGLGYLSNHIADICEKNNHKTFIWAHGGEIKKTGEWAHSNIRENRTLFSNIKPSDILNWAKENEIDVILFMETPLFDIVKFIRKEKFNTRLFWFPMIESVKETDFDDAFLFDKIIFFVKAGFDSFHRRGLTNIYYLRYRPSIPSGTQKLDKEYMFSHIGGRLGVKGRKSTVEVIKAMGMLGEKSIVSVQVGKDKLNT